jgi:hypothetical protein
MSCLRTGSSYASGSGPWHFALAASFVIACAGPAVAKGILGTKGSNKVVGTVTADVIRDWAATTESRVVVVGTGSSDSAAGTDSRAARQGPRR